VPGAPGAPGINVLHRHIANDRAIAWEDGALNRFRRQLDRASHLPYRAACAWKVFALISPPVSIVVVPELVDRNL